MSNENKILTPETNNRLDGKKATTVDVIYPAEPTINKSELSLNSVEIDVSKITTINQGLDDMRSYMRSALYGSGMEFSETAEDKYIEANKTILSKNVKTDDPDKKKKSLVISPGEKGEEKTKTNTLISVKYNSSNKSPFKTTINQTYLNSVIGTKYKTFKEALVALKGIIPSEFNETSLANLNISPVPSTYKPKDIEYEIYQNSSDKGNSQYPKNFGIKTKLFYEYIKIHKDDKDVNQILGTIDIRRPEYYPNPTKTLVQTEVDSVFKNSKPEFFKFTLVKNGNPIKQTKYVNGEHTDTTIDVQLYDLVVNIDGVNYTIKDKINFTKTIINSVFLKTPTDKTLNTIFKPITIKLSDKYSLIINQEFATVKCKSIDYIAPVYSSASHKEFPIYTKDELKDQFLCYEEKEDGEDMTIERLNFYLSETVIESFTGDETNKLNYIPITNECPSDKKDGTNYGWYPDVSKNEITCDGVLKNKNQDFSFNLLTDTESAGGIDTYKINLQSDFTEYSAETEEWLDIDDSANSIKFIKNAALRSTYEGVVGTFSEDDSVVTSEGKYIVNTQHMADFMNLINKTDKYTATSFRDYIIPMNYTHKKTEQGIVEILPTLGEKNTDELAMFELIIRATTKETVRVVNDYLQTKQVTVNTNTINSLNNQIQKSIIPSINGLRTIALQQEKWIEDLYTRNVNDRENILYVKGDIDDLKSSLRNGYETIKINSTIKTSSEFVVINTPSDTNKNLEVKLPTAKSRIGSLIIKSMSSITTLIKKNGNDQVFLNGSLTALPTNYSLLPGKIITLINDGISKWYIISSSETDDIVKTLETKVKTLETKVTALETKVA